MGRGSLGLYGYVPYHGLRSSKLRIFTAVLFGHASGSPGLGPTFAMLGLGCSALAVRWSFARSNFLFFAQQTLALVQAWRLALCPTGAVRAAAEVGEAGGGAGWARFFAGELGAWV